MYAILKNIFQLVKITAGWRSTGVTLLTRDVHAQQTNGMVKILAFLNLGISMTLLGRNFVDAKFACVGSRAGGTVSWQTKPVGQCYYGLLRPI